MSSQVDPYAPLPPAPTPTQLMDPTYRYLRCRHQYCCAGIRQDTIAQWVLAGCPPAWHHQFANLKRDGYTPAQVAAYAPPKSWGNATGEGVLSHLSEYLTQGIPPATVYDYHTGYVHEGHNILTLHLHRCDPATVNDYVPAVMATETNTVRVGASFTAKYVRWAATGASPELIAAFLAHHLPPNEVSDALEQWSGTHLEPDVAARLHQAGITAHEVAAHPDLAAADEHTLTVMAALRR